LLELARLMERSDSSFHPRRDGDRAIQSSDREWAVIIEALRIAADVKTLA
jgi:hypothetical protein